MFSKATVTQQSQSHRTATSCRDCMLVSRGMVSCASRLCFTHTQSLLCHTDRTVTTQSHSHTIYATRESWSDVLPEQQAIGAGGYVSRSKRVTEEEKEETFAAAVQSPLKM